jgi:hypothetical protein
MFSFAYPFWYYSIIQNNSLASYFEFIFAQSRVFNKILRLRLPNIQLAKIYAFNNAEFIDALKKSEEYKQNYYLLGYIRAKDKRIMYMSFNFTQNLLNYTW